MLNQTGENSDLSRAQVASCNASLTSVNSNTKQDLSTRNGDDTKPVESVAASASLSPSYLQIRSVKRQMEKILSLSDRIPATTVTELPPARADTDADSHALRHNAHWASIAQCIERNYLNYDGFVVWTDPDTSKCSVTTLSFKHPLGAASNLCCACCVTKCRQV